MESKEQVINEWMRRSIEYFQNAMDRSGVKSQAKVLYNSLLATAIKNSDGDLKVAIIRFNYYGRYVDMGVGKGVPIGGQKEKTDFLKYRNEKGQLHKYKRKPKKWYSRTLAGRVKTLSELLAEQFGIEVIHILEQGLKTDVRMDLG